MSKKYYLNMKDDFKFFKDIFANCDAQYRKQFKTEVRTLHIIKAFCRNVPLTMVECGDYNDGNFIKVVKYSIEIMKRDANKADFEAFIEWLSYYMNAKGSKFTLTDNKNSINIAML